MQKISNILKSKPKTISFELFPPKTPEGNLKLQDTISSLCQLKPDFFSCTYGAGGGSRDKTLDIVEFIQAQHKIPAMAHLTCVLHTKNEIKQILIEMKRRHISNVLALRGDAPKDAPDWKPGPDNFNYSCDLVKFIREEFGDFFSIGVAGFPEGHLLSKNKDDDARVLKAKIDAGADFVITQLFFNNQDYLDYIKRLKTINVHVPVIPGILPITDYNALIRFCNLCGASITEEIHNTFKTTADDLPTTIDKGIVFASNQCKFLLENGAPGLHFYTLNKISPTNNILIGL